MLRKLRGVAWVVATAIFIGGGSALLWAYALPAVPTPQAAGTPLSPLLTGAVMPGYLLARSVFAVHLAEQTPWACRWHLAACNIVLWTTALFFLRALVQPVLQRMADRRRAAGGYLPHTVG